MLSVFKLADSLTENAFRPEGTPAEPVYDLTGAYNFEGTLEESFYEFREMMLIEAIQYQEEFTAKQEIMTEAAMCNPDAMGALCEASVQGIIEGIKRFFRNVWTFLKGLVKKIKERIENLRVVNATWIKKWEPRVNAAIQAGVDVDVKLHAINKDYIKVSGNALVDQCKKLDDIYKNSMDDAKEQASSLASVIELYNKDLYDSKLNKLIELYQRDLDQFETEFINDVNNLGDVEVKDIKKLSAETTDSLVKAAIGEEKECKFSSYSITAKEMLAFIKDNDKISEEIMKQLNAEADMIKGLEKEYDALDEKYKKLSGGNDWETPDPKVTQQLHDNCFELISKVAHLYTSSLMSVIGGFQTATQKIISATTSEFKSALEKFATGAKPTKADKVAKDVEKFVDDNDKKVDENLKASSKSTANAKEALKQTASIMDANKQYADED